MTRQPKGDSTQTVEELEIARGTPEKAIVRTAIAGWLDVCREPPRS